MLRDAKVVGKFVEFHGDGAANLPVTDRATIANMSPEYGATIGFFPIDEQTCKYLAVTGRSKAQVDLVRNYFTAQGMFGMPRMGECDYTQVLDLETASAVEPSSAAANGRRRERMKIRSARLDPAARVIIDPRSGPSSNTLSQFIVERIMTNFGRKRQPRGDEFLNSGPSPFLIGGCLRTITNKQLSS